MSASYPPAVAMSVLNKARNWPDFNLAVAGLSTKDKGDAFELLVKCYLQIEPAYATKLSHVWLLNEVPLAIAKRLNLPSQDQGIDLVAQTIEGAFWAIQCKYREDQATSLTWREVSTFTGLAFGVCRNISFGLVCTTTERLTSVLHVQDNIAFCASDVWAGLDRDFFNRLHAILKHKHTPLRPLTPRPHQQRAIANAYKHFITERNTRGKMIMPCGAGKSLAAYWIARKLAARTVLVAVPSLALIRQTLKVWLKESLASGMAVEWVCVCSDETAGQVGRDDIAVLKQDLGVPCLTDTTDIASWLKASGHGAESADRTSRSPRQSRARVRVVFTTYQSGKAIADAARSCKCSFDLGILDEAHKTVGATDKLFSHLLHDKNIAIRHRLFMTATERRYLGKSDEIASMDDTAVYGDTFDLLTFKHALECRPPILSDYRILTIMVTYDEVADAIKRNILVKPHSGTWDREVEAEMLASLIALRKAMRTHPIRHAVSFHSSIARAEVFKASQDNFNAMCGAELGTVEAFHVSGKTPTGVRARILNEFTVSRRALITNARCLTEGVDVPDIDCVLFADPRKSTIDIVQAVGRALRPAKGKKYGYIIIPVLYDVSKGIKSLMESEAFGEMLTTLRALASNDERIIEHFRSVSTGARHTGTAKGGIVETPADEFLAKHIDLDTFVSSIELKCWSRLAKLSWRPFEEARSFAQGLRLKGQKEWFMFCKGNMPAKGVLPPDIPVTPHTLYANKGWKSFGDWLGTGNIASSRRTFLSFREARRYARGLGLKFFTDWVVFCKGDMPSKGKLPLDIPANPNQVYDGKGWHSMGDWLGTGVISTHRREHRPFEEARKFAQGLGLKSTTEWRMFCKGDMPSKGKRPSDIPATPHSVYANQGWQSWGDWLGTPRRHGGKRLFHKAREFARSLCLRSSTEWQRFCRGEIPSKGTLPPDIPAYPNKTYVGKGWKGFGDWLGTMRQHGGMRLFHKAREFARSLCLRSSTEWQRFCRGEIPSKGKRPPDIPSNPDKTYAGKGWNGMTDWLGMGTIAPSLQTPLPFEEARKYARSLRLISSLEWRMFCKGDMPSKGNRPPNIPANPGTTYADKGWKGFGDWLGTGNIAPFLRKYRPFEEARKYVQSLRLKSGTEWSAFCKDGKQPADIPASPGQIYAGKGWQGMGDWLGTGTIAPSLRKFRLFGEAREYVRSLGLKSGSEWRKICKGDMPSKGKIPSDIPTNPNQTYAGKGWHGMGDWLGTGRIADQFKVYLPFRKARAFARKLKLKSQTEWFCFCKGKLSSKSKLPPDIPASANRIYAGKGWQSWGDWLGSGTIATRLRKYKEQVR